MLTNSTAVTIDRLSVFDVYLTGDMTEPQGSFDLPLFITRGPQ